MIVVGIIGLLATIGIQSFSKSQSTASKITCISNLQQIEGAIHSWALDTRQGDDSSVVASDILSYMNGVITCPSGGKTFSDSYSITTVNTKPTCIKVPLTHKLPEDTLQ
jgi:type II secretory pathway pseudopilin PulG